METKERLLSALRDSLDEPGRQWLEQAIGSAARGSLDDLLTAYTAASRRIGNSPLHDGTGAQPGMPGFDRWTCEDAARALLLLARAEGFPATFKDDAVACYELGDAREQQSWLRAVGLLPGPEQFIPVAVDACRSSISPIFEAVACENPYPSRYFPELNFNQMVLKSLFSGVALSRIVGLEGRLNAELTRMAADYAAERRAAGRSVPADIGMAMQDRARPEEQTR
jgi:hypothetical protein